MDMDMEGREQGQLCQQGLPLLLVTLLQRRHHRTVAAGRHSMPRRPMGQWQGLAALLWARSRLRAQQLPSRSSQRHPRGQSCLW